MTTPNRNPLPNNYNGLFDLQNLSVNSEFRKHTRQNLKDVQSLHVVHYGLDGAHNSHTPSLDSNLSNLNNYSLNTTSLQKP